jgi:ketosteroid isomerase-like protein
LAGEITTKDMRSELIRRVFNDFNKDTMYLLDEFYSAAVVFEDPINRLDGLDALRDYYANVYKNVTSISFDVTNEVVEGDTHVIMWKMHMTAEKLNKGKPTLTHGTSVIRFNEEHKVTYHRDYFDMGEMLYQHVPVLGYLVKKANAKLESGKNG